MKSRKSVGFNQRLKSEKRQLAEQQGTSSISVNKEAGKLEDRLNYYHLVQLNELFKVQKCLMMLVFFIPFNIIFICSRAHIHAGWRQDRQRNDSDRV